MKGTDTNFLPSATKGTTALLIIIIIIIHIFVMIGELSSRGFLIGIYIPSR